MTAGIEFYKNGVTTFSLTTYTGAFYGSFSTGGATTGTHQDDRLIGRTLLHYVLDMDNDFGGPNVSLDPATGTITWNYAVSVNGGTAPAPPNDTIYYGGY